MGEQEAGMKRSFKLGDSSFNDRIFEIPEEGGGLPSPERIQQATQEYQEQTHSSLPGVVQEATPVGSMEIIDTRISDLFYYIVDRPNDTPEIRKRRIAFGQWLIASFPTTEFTGEEKMLWLAIKHICGDVRQSFRVSYAMMYIRSEIMPLLLKEKVRVSGTESLACREDDHTAMHTLAEATIEIMQQTLNLIENTERDVNDFAMVADEFMITRREDRFRELMSIANQTMAVGTWKMSGTSDAMDFMALKIRTLQMIYDRTKLESIEDGGGTNYRLEFCHYTGIPSLDKQTMGTFLGWLFGIEAPTGYGKTTFLVSLCYAAAVPQYTEDPYGFGREIKPRNVCILQGEQPKEEIQNMLIARHIYTLHGIVIPHKLMTADALSPTQKAYYEEAKLDLFESGKYGKIYIKGYYDFYLTTLREDLESIDSLQGPFDVWGIDYVALFKFAPIGSGIRTQLNTSEVIAEGYKSLKRFAGQRHKLVLAANQLNKSGDDKARSDVPVEVGDVKGGVEAHMSCDHVEVLMGTDQMVAQNFFHRQTAKGRMAGTSIHDLIACRDVCAYDDPAPDGL